MSINHSDLGEATVRIGLTEAKAVFVKSESCTCPCALSTYNLVAVLKLAVEYEVGIGLAVVWSNKLSNYYLYYAVCRLILGEACFIVVCSRNNGCGPYGRIGKYGNDSGIHIATCTRTLGSTSCGFCRSCSHGPCAVCMVVVFGKSYGNSAESLGGVYLFTLSKVRGLCGNLGGPYGCVCKNRNNTGVLIATCALALSRACSCFSSSCGYSPCAIGMAFILRKSNRNCAVKVRGVYLCTLSKVRGLYGNLRGPYGCVCKSSHGNCFAGTALASLCCFACSGFGRSSSQCVCPLVRNHIQSNLNGSIHGCVGYNTLGGVGCSGNFLCPNRCIIEGRNNRFLVIVATGTFNLGSTGIIFAGQCCHSINCVVMLVLFNLVRGFAGSK